MLCYARFLNLIPLMEDFFFLGVYFFVTVELYIHLDIAFCLSPLAKLFQHNVYSVMALAFHRICDQMQSFYLTRSIIDYKNKCMTSNPC